jgi:hypothetical protein
LPSSPLLPTAGPLFHLLVQVHNWKFGALYYCLLLGLFLYVVVYSVVLNKGYQQYENAVGTIEFFVRGAVTDGRAVYDETDITHPFRDHDAFFVQTSYATLNQSQGACADTEETYKCDPRNVTSCAAGLPSRHGLTTGLCLEQGYCQIEGWCPAEPAAVDFNLFEKITDVTIGARIDAEFPLFDISVRAEAFVRLFRPRLTASTFPLTFSLCRVRSTARRRWRDARSSSIRHSVRRIRHIPPVRCRAEVRCDSAGDGHLQVRPQSGRGRLCARRQCVRIGQRQTGL